MDYDVVFIGGGTGGYVGAIKAASLGLKTALIERDRLGGTCLLRGCIPTKTLIAHAEVYRTIRCAQDFGIHVSDVSFDYAQMVHRKNDVVDSLCQGVQFLLSANNVDVITGTASFVDTQEIRITNDSVKTITSTNTIIATGSIPTAIPSAPVDGKLIHDSTTILEMTTLPKHLIVLGGGYIGCEFASLFAALGIQVTLIEALPGIVWTQGTRISEFLTQQFTQQGIQILADTKMEKCETANDQVTLYLSNNSTITGDMLLVSVGRTPYTDNLGLNEIALGTNLRGFIEVDEYMRTPIPNVYAIGDVTGKAMLAHMASHQGICAAFSCANQMVPMHYHAVPAVIFTHPEIATVGYTLEQAQELGFVAESAIFPFAALGKAKAAGHEEGYAEIIFEKSTERILGAFMVGHEAGTMIAEMTLAITSESTLGLLADTIAPHPTLSESWMEAAHIARGQPLHLPPKVAK